MDEPLPPMPASMPTFLYLHPPDDNFVRLRGGEWFAAMREVGFSVITSADIDDAGGVELDQGKTLNVFAAVDGGQTNVDTLLNLAANPRTCVLVDVTGAFWTPDHLIGADAQQFWSDPDNQARGLRLVEGVDGLVTPHTSAVGALLELNPQVFIVPDVVEDDDDEHDCAALMRFGRALTLAWHTAREVKVAAYWERQRAGSPN